MVGREVGERYREEDVGGPRTHALMHPSFLIILLALVRNGFGPVQA